MRQVVLDTETTGLSVADGHRVIELACVELINRQASGRHWHHYFDPERDIDEGAQAVHGLSRERLEGEPKFADLATDFLDFVGDAEVLIHNAPFDLGFLRAELGRVGLPELSSQCQVTDTLMLARELHPGKRNSLDALCERYGISNAHRSLHGALLDARLLADVYLAMTRGQESLEIGLVADATTQGLGDEQGDWPPQGLKQISLSSFHQSVHEAYHAAMEKDARGPSLWRRLQQTQVR
ncbi:MAG: DNA polymerase III subunit epsilon [Burkholderiales bacterium]|mgnify:FL=1|jgi:DNA polymerase-3 subunit epsilon|nr:DNA polymerase III subunit epsilon [Burkholderiaceae bacterium]NBS81958.1 DNA polymerase III subunit epsilon [Betaproteobacteria bacterium]NCX03133.1 DNA polymerase III subunit epsilon [Betaproteobacteria bacterium]NDE31933.1 DNA polymerase III subunit epsilon [Betaproteobacteria bacterium]